MARPKWFSIAISFMLSLCPVTAFAADSNYVITLDKDVFTPAELVVPAGQKIKLTIKNLTTSAAEFESSDLNREKVVAANSEIIVYLGPLDAGSYGYFNDFQRTTTGKILVK